jgi:hypothetical protein
MLKGVSTISAMLYLKVSCCLESNRDDEYRRGVAESCVSTRFAELVLDLVFQSIQVVDKFDIKVQRFLYEYNLVNWIRQENLEHGRALYRQEVNK